MQRIVFCDTNILLSENFNLNNYDKVLISVVSLEELDGLKKSEDVGYKARRIIKELKDAENVEYVLYEKGNLVVFLDHKNDNKILQMAYDSWMDNKEVLFLTDDFNLFVKSKSIGLPCELFENKECEIYSGIKYIEINEADDNIEKILASIDITELTENEYILLGFWEYVEKYEQKQFQLVKGFRWTDKQFIDVKSPRLGDKLNECFRDNAEQRLIYDALNDDGIDILVVFGVSGSGKDFSVLANCLNNVSKPSKNKRGMYKSKSILYTRSTVEVGQKQGFLPGSAQEKSAMYMLPAQQNINKIFDILGKEEDYTSLVDAGMYNEVPLAYMRGSTYNDSYMILDESANSSLEEVKMFISRAGEGSKSIILGSLNQIDNKYNSYSNNALYKVIQAFKGQSNCVILELKNQHRSLLALQCDKLLK